MNNLTKSISFLACFISLTSTVFAYTGDIAINQQNIRFSTSTFQEGQAVRIYASVSNNSSKDLLGVVKFYINDQQLGADQAISIFGNKTDDVFIDWVPGYGSQKVAVKIFPWNPEIDDPSNNHIVSNIFSIQDTDHDGTPNDKDTDDDGDNVPDTEDDFPLNKNEQHDTDGDGLGNNTDKDDDNDGVPDNHDDLPLDPNETTDTDQDGIGNNADNDDDNDELTDAEEENIGTNPLNEDTDEDGTIDGQDAFPSNKNEQLDTDKDGIGNNIDTDDDNDGIKDETDPFPLNKEPVLKIKAIDPNDIKVNLMQKNTFDASPSYDDDGEIVSYQWDIDGQTYEGQTLNHVFTKLGKTPVKLTLTDDKGQSISQEFQVNVLNTRLYKEIFATLIAILLALVIYMKYIRQAKNSSHK
ncbi:hypothetical protein COU74_04040 [Candidatus Peregrinibacteria bacterium CG10_big_fil_rev_8_21_14_0_10_36_19]|nr:MAG: hypothetical protein COU74_04040 [Candidatus Peregrinibacteria bacterium CG10_big_fil_rev_8_21_14_0_10_36_19]